MMKAVQFKKYGGPDVLGLIDMDVPQVGEKEVLIDVKAIGVNYADTARREGQYVVPTPLPFVPGAEIAGVVTEVGKNVRGVEKGKRVVTLIEQGGYAEYAVAPAKGLIPIPDGVEFEEAVALPLQGLTAYHTLKTMGRLAQGDTVLIHAATGEVQMAGVSLSNGDYVLLRLTGVNDSPAPLKAAELAQYQQALGARVGQVDFESMLLQFEMDAKVQRF